MAGRRGRCQEEGADAHPVGLHQFTQLGEADLEQAQIGFLQVGEGVADGLAHALQPLQAELRGVGREAVLLECCAVERADRAEPPRVDRIGLVVAEGVLHGVEVPCHQGVEDQHAVAGPGERGSPVQVEHTGSFDQDQELSGCTDVPAHEREQRAPAGGGNREVLFAADPALRSGERGADFLFCDINAEEVSWFH